MTLNAKGECLHYFQMSRTSIFIIYCMRNLLSVPYLLKSVVFGIQVKLRRLLRFMHLKDMKASLTRSSSVDDEDSVDPGNHVNVTSLQCATDQDAELYMLMIC